MASKTNETAVKITGDGSSAVAAVKQTADTVKTKFGEMQGVLSGLGSMFEKVTGAFGGFAAILGGIGLASIKRTTDAFATHVERTRDLARSLNITTNEVAGLEAALDDIDATTAEYEQASRMLATQLRQNEDGVRKLGLATRDAQGNLRPMQDLMLDGIKVLNEYKEGTDRNIAAQTLFGRSGDGSSRIFMLNTEVMERGKIAAEELGLVIGGNATAAWEEYNVANDRVGYTMRAFSKAIAETVMPAVTTLMEYFNSFAPAAIQVVRGALGGLTTAFLGLVNGVRLVWEVINAMVFSVAEPILALGRAVAAMARGDFAQAGREISGVSGNIADAWERAYVNMEESSATTAERIKRLWSAAAGDIGGTGASGSVVGTRSAPAKEAFGGGKTGKETTRVGEWEATLQERRIAYQKENDLREMSKTMELAYWRDLSLMADLNSRERVDIRKRMATTELEVLKQAAAQQAGLNEQEIEARKIAGLGLLDAIKQEAQFKVDTQQMTQAELLQLDQELENERFRITAEAIQARLALLATDPTKNVVALQKLNDELAQVERDHQVKQRGTQLEIFKQQLGDWQSFFDSIGQSFGNTVAGLIQGTMTWGQAVGSLFRGLLSTVAGFIGQILAKKVAAWAVEKTLTMAGIGANAAKAGSGAAASQASIPFVGPMLALAAMAAVFTAVMGMGSKVPSAKGGFDIPAGLNPLTQLHEEEMVLPRQEADVIRSMADSSGSPILINTTGGDFVHRNDLAALLKKLNRNFEFTS